MGTVLFSNHESLVRSFDKNNNKVMDELTADPSIQSRVDTDKNGSISTQELTSALSNDTVEIQQGKIVANKGFNIYVDGLETLKSVHSIAENAISNTHFYTPNVYDSDKGQERFNKLVRSNRSYSAAIDKMETALSSVRDVTAHKTDSTSRALNIQATTALQNTSWRVHLATFQSALSIMNEFISDTYITGPGNYKPADPFASDPFKSGSSSAGSDPFKSSNGSYGKDPFSGSSSSAGKDPFSGSSSSAGKDPFSGSNSSAGKDPFKSNNNSYGKDPFSGSSSNNSYGKDPFSGSSSSAGKDPFSGGSSSSSPYGKDPFNQNGSPYGHDPFQPSPSQPIIPPPDPFLERYRERIAEQERINTHLQVAYETLNTTVKTISKQTNDVPDISKSVKAADTSISRAFSTLNQIENSAQSKTDVVNKLNGKADAEKAQATGRTGPYAGIGAGIGAAAGGAIGFFAGGHNVKNALIGAGIGAAVSAGIGALIGHSTDQKYIGNANEFTLLADEVNRYQVDSEKTTLLGETQKTYSELLSARNVHDLDGARVVTNNFDTIYSRVSPIETKAARILAAYK